MLLWSVSFFLFACAIRSLGPELGAWGAVLGLGRERAQLQRFSFVLQEMEESLLAGLSLSQGLWERLGIFPAPWGPLALESLQELRSRGSSLLPTLKRLRGLANEHSAALAEARAKSSQALAQAAASGVLMPVMGGLLYLILPGVSGSPTKWMLACALALSFGAFAALWTLKMTEEARWGGLEGGKRSWVLAAQCAGERFLALVRAGSPPDLAWGRACELLAGEAADLASAWGFSVWREPAGGASRAKGPAAHALISTGSAIRKAVQMSVMEGRGCTERVEGVLAALRQDLKANVEREISLLSTRALKPLFLFVAPALFGLLFYGLFLSWSGIAGGAGFAF